MQSTAEPGPRRRLLRSRARLLPRDCPAPGAAIHELQSCSASPKPGKITSKGGRKGWGRNMHQQILVGRQNWGLAAASQRDGCAQVVLVLPWKAGSRNRLKNLFPPGLQNLLQDCKSRLKAPQLVPTAKQPRSWCCFWPHLHAEV